MLRTAHFPRLAGERELGLGRAARDPALVITRVEGKSGLRDFLAVPARLYADDPCWIPPLLREERQFLSLKNPYLRVNPIRLFVARRKGRPVGRIAATVSHAHNAYHGERTGFFGFFECDGEPAAAALLAAAADFLAAAGMAVMRGPCNLTTNHTCGLLVEGFGGPPLIDMPYNPPGYARWLEDQGFVKAKDLLAYWIDLAGHTPEPGDLAPAARRAPAGFRVREMALSGRGATRDLEAFHDLYHHAWRDNWGFVPLDREEYGFLFRRLRPVLAPGLSFVAEVDGSPAGMFLGIPDYNRVLRVLNGRLTPAGLVRAFVARRRIDAARYLLTGIYDTHRGTPVASLLLHRCLDGARARGYRGVEISWVLEDNEPANRFFCKHGLRVHRRYRIYDRRLG
jgi:GNAT superfamily N-acetyltransferase